MDRGRAFSNHHCPTSSEVLLEKYHMQAWATRCLITDNGRQFSDGGFEKFLQQLGIKNKVTSVEHPSTNGQAEAANKVILNELKKELSQAKGLRLRRSPEFYEDIIALHSQQPRKHLTG